MSPYIAPIKQFNHPAFTLTALNSRAQRRVAHAGLQITHMTEPQRGSTMNQHSMRQLQRKISAIVVNELMRHDTRTVRCNDSQM